MSALFENAVASIRMGIEDYRSQDQFRDISAVRNYYAGLLLLAKEALVRRVPNENPDLILAAKMRPVLDGQGIVMVPDGNVTVDFVTIGRRLKDFGIQIDVGRLDELRKIRNDLEHKYSTAKPEAIKRAIAKGFPVIAELFRILDKGPAMELGDAWTTMLDTTELYEEELIRARTTRLPIRWHSATVRRSRFECPECSSELIVQRDPDNCEQDKVVLACEACATLIIDRGEFIEAMVDQVLGAEAFIRAKETGEDGPIYDCPSCGKATFIDHEWACANCSYGLKDDAGRCQICYEAVPLSELLLEPQRTLCSYHHYQASKDD
jgi:ribosomal protein S27AE